MKSSIKKLLALMCVAVTAVFTFNACSVSLKTDNTDSSSNSEMTSEQSQLLEDIMDSVFSDDDISAIKEATQILPENDSYNSKDAVALYIHLYGKLPSNYITKEEAEKLGWDGGEDRGGRMSVETFAPGKSIGGDTFENKEGLLPEKEGRTYTECDVDCEGTGSRGDKRIVFSNDGLIFYTDNHYESFEQLYGE